MVFKKRQLARKKRINLAEFLTNCSWPAVETMHLSFLDSCYENDLRKMMEAARADNADNYAKAISQEEDLEMDEKDGAVKWKLTDSVLFCFTVITTIGYGNVAPKTFNGRLFVIFYGLIGVPCTMLAIANLGKFLAALLKSWTKPFINCFKKLRKSLCKKQKHLSKEKQRLMESKSITRGEVSSHRLIQGNDDWEDSGGEADKEEEKEEDEEESTQDALVLFLSFVVYIIIGSVVISSYEPQMNFFEAIYFNFVTLTTIGLGDLVPQSDSFLVCTLIYCAVGLALTTIAIEIAADYLKQLHYFGRKIDNVGTVQVWFGGKKLTMKQLVRNLGDQFNVPVDQLANLNMDQFVEDAMRVEAGELSTLRHEQQPYMASDYWRAIEGSSLHFVDDDDMVAMQANRRNRELAKGDRARRRSESEMPTGSPLSVPETHQSSRSSGSKRGGGEGRTHGGGGGGGSQTQKLSISRSSLHLKEPSSTHCAPASPPSTSTPHPSPRSGPQNLLSVMHTSTIKDRKFSLQPLNP